MKELLPKISRRDAIAWLGWVGFGFTSTFIGSVAVFGLPHVQKLIREKQQLEQVPYEFSIPVPLSVEAQKDILKRFENVYNKLKTSADTTVVDIGNGYESYQFDQDTKIYRLTDAPATLEVYKDRSKTVDNMKSIRLIVGTADVEYFIWGLQLYRVIRKNKPAENLQAIEQSQDELKEEFSAVLKSLEEDFQAWQEVLLPKTTDQPVQ